MIEQVNAFVAWAEALRTLLLELAKQDTPYPFDENTLHNPVSPTTLVPRSLQPLYAVCNGVSLPDVHNGYFIDPVHLITSEHERGLPEQIGTKYPVKIQVFGSDGGGSYFAVGSADGSVYYLPSQGAVENHVYVNDPVLAHQISDSVIGFLERLLSDVDAFVHMSDQHVYIEKGTKPGPPRG